MYAKQGLTLREEIIVGRRTQSRFGRHYSVVTDQRQRSAYYVICYVPPNDREADVKLHNIYPTRRPKIPRICPGLLSNPTRTRTDTRGKHTRSDPQHRGTHDRGNYDPTTSLEHRPQCHQLQSYSGRKNVR